MSQVLEILSQCKILLEIIYEPVKHCHHLYNQFNDWHEKKVFVFVRVDLLVAAARADVQRGLDRAGFRRRIVLGRARGGSGRSGAPWRWSLGGFRTLQGAREGGSDSPSDLSTEGEKHVSGLFLFRWSFNMQRYQLQGI